MAVESANYLGELVQTYPAETEGVAEGDDHLRTIKKTLKQTFPGRTKPEDTYTELAGASVAFVAAQIGQMLVPLSATTIALPKLGTDYEGYTFKFIPGVNGTLAGVGGDTVNGAGSLTYEAGGVYFASGASGVAWKVYRAGGGAASFSSGTRMPFAQAAAPVGWTQDTSDNANNRMLRVVSGGGNGVGGSHSPILNNVVPSHTHGVTVYGTDTNHTHNFQTDWEADHTHGYTIRTPTFGQWGWNQVYGAVANSYSDSGAATSAAGGHDHYGTTGYKNQNASHTHSASTDGGSSSTNWTPRYIDMIICARN